MEDHQRHVQPVRDPLGVARADRGRLQQQHRAQPAGDQDRIDRLAAVLAPVDVIEVEPQRELVKGERGTDSEQRRQHLGPRRPGVVTELEQAGEQHQQDAPHLVVHVDAGDVDVREAAITGFVVGLSVLVTGAFFLARIRLVIPRVIANVTRKPISAHTAAARPVSTRTR